MYDLEQMIKQAEKNGADFLEIRLDYIRGNYNPRDIRKLSKLPLIATNRPLKEGGLFEGPEKERIRMLSSSADSEFNFIDIELSSEGLAEIIQRIKDSGAEIIVSHHIFDSTPNPTKNT